MKGRCKIEFVIDAMASVILFVNILLPIVGYSYLPESIPVGFDDRGEADLFRPRWIVFLFPFLSLFFYGFAWLISKLPAMAKAKRVLTFCKAGNTLLFVLLTAVLIFWPHALWTVLMVALGALFLLIIAGLLYVVFRRGNL